MALTYGHSGIARFLMEYGVETGGIGEIEWVNFAASGGLCLDAAREHANLVLDYCEPGELGKPHGSSMRSLKVMSTTPSCWSMADRVDVLAIASSASQNVNSWIAEFNAIDDNLFSSSLRNHKLDHFMSVLACQVSRGNQNEQVATAITRGFVAYNDFDQWSERGIYPFRTLICDLGRDPGAREKVHFWVTCAEKAKVDLEIYGTHVKAAFRQRREVGMRLGVSEGWIIAIDTSVCVTLDCLDHAQR